jgi:hypothetical protein
MAQKCPSAKEYSLVQADASILFNLTFDVFMAATIFIGVWGNQVIT